MAYKRKYKKSKKSYKKSWLSKKGRSKKSWRMRKYKGKALKKSKVWLKPVAGIADILRAQFTYSQRLTDQAIVANGIGSNFYCKQWSIKGNIPSDPLFTNDTVNAAYYDFISTYYNKVAVLHSKIEITWQPTYTTAQTGFVSLVPYRNEDFLNFIASGSVNPASFQVTKQMPYAQVKTYTHGMGSTTTLKFKHRMSSTKLLGRAYDPSLDDMATATATTQDNRDFVWLLTWLSDTKTAGLQCIVNFKITYWCTFKDRIVPTFPVN